MIENIAVKSGFSLLKSLLAVAVVALVLVSAPKDAMAQSTPSTIGYVVTGCDITTDNGTYNYIGTDYAGNPYYASISGSYLYAGGDDQEGRPYYLWYIGTNVGTYEGAFIGYRDDDYETWNAAGPDWGTELVSVGPATSDSMSWIGDVYGNSEPNVTSL